MRIFGYRIAREMKLSVERAAETNTAFERGIATGKEIGRLQGQIDMLVARQDARPAPMKKKTIRKK